VAKGFSVHVGLSFLDEKKHNGKFSAPGCDRAATQMKAIADKLHYTESVELIDRKATKKAVTDKIAELAGRLTADDILFITLAGHGIRHLATGVPDEKRDQAFLLFDDKLVDDEVYKLLASINVPARVMIVAEACFSGTLAQETGVVPETDTSGTMAAEAAVAAAQTDVAYRDALVRLQAESTASLQNLERFQVRAERFLVGREPIHANVLLLAAASDENVIPRPVNTRDGLPPFTSAIVQHWEAATDYHDLRRKIAGVVARTSRLAEPVLNETLVNGPSFLLNQPFRIA
jgi:hypothetical protein